jgi:hypothetical protein
MRGVIGVEPASASARLVVLVLLAGIAAPPAPAQDATSSQSTVEQELQAAALAKALSDAQKAAADAQKAAIEAELAALKAQYSGFTASDYKGDVKLGASAGAAEAALLAAKAIDEAAERILSEVKSPLGEKVAVILASSTGLSIQAALSYDAQKQAVEAAYTAAEALSEQANKTVTPKAEVSVSGVATAGVLLEGLNKLFSYFRTDYEVTGVAVALSETALLQALAGKILGSVTPPTPPRSVFLPQSFDLQATEAIQTILADVKTLSERRLKAVQAAEVHEKQTGTGAEEHKKAAKALREAVAFDERLFVKLTSADDKGTIPIVQVARERTMRKELEAGALVLQATLHYQGGSQYTRKNMWTFFGARPYFHMGGTVVSYVLLEGKSGKVLASGLVPVHGGFVQATKVEKEVEGKKSKEGASGTTPEGSGGS